MLTDPRKEIDVSAWAPARSFEQPDIDNDLELISHIESLIYVGARLRKFKTLHLFLLLWMPQNEVFMDARGGQMSGSLQSPSQRVSYKKKA